MGLDDEAAAAVALVDSATRPPWTILLENFERQSSHLIFICRGTKFKVEVLANDLANTDYLEQYSRLIDEDDDRWDLRDWIFTPTLPICLEETSGLSWSTVTLKNRFFQPTVRLRICVKENKLVAERDIRSFPLFPLQERKTLDNRCLLRLADLNVPRIADTDLTIIPPDDLSQFDPALNVPIRVRAKDGSVYFFKPCRDEHQFEREVRITSQIKEFDLHQALPVSHLHSIVVRGKFVFGLIFELIHHDHGSLDVEHMADVIPASVDQWEQQVKDILETLHAHDIVWGDVQPGNIMVDHDGNACVIDFGGSYSPGFIPEELAETKEGDWVGFRRVFEWLRNGRPVHTGRTE